MAKLTKRSPAIEDAIKRIYVLLDDVHQHDINYPNSAGGYQLLNIPLEDIKVLMEDYHKLRRSNNSLKKLRTPGEGIFIELMQQNITQAIINGGTGKWVVTVPVLGRLALRIRALQPLTKKT